MMIKYEGESRVNRKLIVFDIDGTLVTTGNEILESTKVALAALLEEGHEITIATGRNFSAAQAIIEELNLDAYVLCNGSMGYIKHELVHEATLSKSTIAKLIEVATKNNQQIVFQTAKGAKRYFEGEEDETLSVFDVKPEHDPTYWEENPILQVTVCSVKEKLIPYDIPELEDIRFVHWHPFGSDAIPKSSTKANTILTLAKEKGFNREDIIFFGDGMNDTELMIESGLGIAMGNSNPELKEIADMVTDSHTEDGIFNALKRLKLI
jgi:Cof subfamily protein (haloacid dehalogenase superfamily)